MISISPLITLVILFKNGKNDISKINFITI